MLVRLSNHFVTFLPFCLWSILKVTLLSTFTTEKHICHIPSKGQTKTTMTKSNLLQTGTLIIDT